MVLTVAPFSLAKISTVLLESCMMTSAVQWHLGFELGHTHVRVKNQSNTCSSGGTSAFWSLRETQQPTSNNTYIPPKR